MDNEDRVSVVVGDEKGDIGVTHNGGGSVKELKVYRSKKKEKLKREREVHSDGSESSEDLLVRLRKFTRQEIEVDSKRTMLDVFEYDEYDEIVLVKKSKKVRFQEDQDNNGGSSSSVLGLKTAELPKEGQCSSKAIDKGKSLSVPQKEVRMKKKKKYEMTEDGKFVAVSMPAKNPGTESSNEMVQREDDNVLKMMVKKKAGKSKKSSELKREGTGKGLRSADTTTQESQPSPPFSPEKNQVNTLKSSTINIKVHDRMSEKSVVSSSLGSRHKRSTKLKKEIRNKGLKTLKSKLSRSTGHRDKNVGDSRSTEQQRIRGQIRTILLNAGWTIEHRQRSNRDYQDSIYISPKGGGGLWSIVKAYNAFIKEWKNEGGESSKSFTPLPDEDISQLTRKRHSKEERMADKAKKRAGEGSTISKKTGEKRSKKESQ